MMLLVGGHTLALSALVQSHKPEVLNQLLNSHESSQFSFECFQCLHAPLFSCLFGGKNDQFGYQSGYQMKVNGILSSKCMKERYIKVYQRTHRHIGKTGEICPRISFQGQLAKRYWRVSLIACTHHPSCFSPQLKSQPKSRARWI